MLDSLRHSDQIISTICLENISDSGGDNALGEDGVRCSITASASVSAAGSFIRLELTLDLMLELSLQLGI